jgi:transcriptional regulator with PAS, ATPase and Fis domain
MQRPPVPAFCRVITSTREGLRRCELDGTMCLNRIRETHSVDIFTCHAGFTEVAVPIVVGGRYYGCFTTHCGVLSHEPNTSEFEKILEQVRDIGVDPERLREAYFQTNPVSSEVLDVMIRLFNVAVSEIVRAAAESEQDKRRIAELESAVYEKYNFERIVGKSQAMQDVLGLLSKVIDSDSPILIEGESGTGKELIATTIHYNSTRKGGRFTAINCGAFAESLLESELFGYVKGAFTGALKDKKGLFEVTDQGTLFLDEISEMSASLQIKLLRVLENGEFLPVGATEPRRVDVRLISATNKNLKELVEKGSFREDLYYRLNVVKVTLPSLRERREDIPLLVKHFIKVISAERGKKVDGLSEEAMKQIMQYHWPGNIRELRNVIERAIALTRSKDIRPEDLPEEILCRDHGVECLPVGMTFKEAKKHFQKEYLKGLLAQSKGNVTRAAQQAGMGRSTFQHLLKRYKIKANDFRPR